MNILAREAVSAAMATGEYGTCHTKDFSLSKQTLRDTVGHQLTLLHTDDRVPICVLKHRQAVNLQAILANEGVLAVSGFEFEGLDASYVRLRIPQNRDMERLLCAIRKIDQVSI